MNPFNGAQPVGKYDADELEFYSWFERDRACVEIRHKETQETIWEAWDDDVYELVEAGYLNARDLRGSAMEHASRLGLI